MMSNAVEQGARLDEVIRYLGMTQKAFAQHISISPSFVTNMVFGKKGISARVINSVTNNYPEVNVSWLLTGDGTMIFEKKSEKRDAEEPEPGRVSVVEEGGEQYKENWRPLVEDVGLRAVLAEMRGEIERLLERVAVLEGEIGKQ